MTTRPAPVLALEPTWAIISRVTAPRVVDSPFIIGLEMMRFLSFIGPSATASFLSTTGLTLTTRGDVHSLANSVGSIDLARPGDIVTRLTRFHHEGTIFTPATNWTFKRLADSSSARKQARLPPPGLSTDYETVALECRCRGKL